MTGGEMVQVLKHLAQQPTQEKINVLVLERPAPVSAEKAEKNNTPGVFRRRCTLLGVPGNAGNPCRSVKMKRSNWIASQLSLARWYVLGLPYLDYAFK